MSPAFTSDRQPQSAAAFLDQQPQSAAAFLDAPPPAPVGFWGGVAHGFGNVAAGLAQAGAHMGSPEEGGFYPADPANRAAAHAMTAGLDRAVRQREGTYQAARMAAGDAGPDWGARIGEALGDALLSAPLMAVPGAGPAATLAGTLGRGALLGGAGGALGGAASPVYGADYAQQKAKQMGLGAGAGAALGGSLDWLAREIGASGIADTIPGIRRDRAGMEGMQPSAAGELLRRPDRAIAGEAVRPPAGLNAWQRDEWRLADHLYDAFERQMPAQTPVAASHLRDAVRSLAEEGHGAGDPMVGRLATLLKAKNAVPFGELKALRTDIGMPRGYVQRQIREALTGDMREAAQQRGPEALAAFERANGNYQRFSILSDRLKKLTKAADDTTAFRRFYRAATRAGDNPKLLASVKDVMPPQGWRDLTAAVTRQLGEGSSEGRFSLGTFGKNWAKLSDGAKDTLFGPRGSDVRDGLERLSRSLVGRAATAIERHPFIAAGTDLGAIGAVLAHSGGLSAAAAAAGPLLLAKALLMPGFARGLATAIERGIPAAAGAFGNQIVADRYRRPMAAGVFLSANP
ncbi:MAG TPA: hypothetical protein VME41_14035 [Stellaceae bacterium]|nr:hypothetical protein [Stellaceae bacterium]